MSSLQPPSDGSFRTAFARNQAESQIDRDVRARYLEEYLDDLRWRGIGSFGRDIRQGHRQPDEDLKNRIKTAVTNIVDIAAIPEEDKDCSICTLGYDTHVEGSDWAITHSPIKTPCGHLFGSTCLWTWLYDNKSNTCPHCRYVLFEKWRVTDGYRYWSDTFHVPHMRRTPTPGTADNLEDPSAASSVIELGLDGELELLRINNNPAEHIAPLDPRHREMSQRFLEGQTEIATESGLRAEFSALIARQRDMLGAVSTERRAAEQLRLGSEINATTPVPRDIVALERVRREQRDLFIRSPAFEEQYERDPFPNPTSSLRQLETSRRDLSAVRSGAFRLPEMHTGIPINGPEQRRGWHPTENSQQPSELTPSSPPRQSAPWYHAEALRRLRPVNAIADRLPPRRVFSNITAPRRLGEVFRSESERAAPMAQPDGPPTSGRTLAELVRQGGEAFTAQPEQLLTPPRRFAEVVGPRREAAVAEPAPNRPPAPFHRNELPPVRNRNRARPENRNMSRFNGRDNRR